MRDARSARFLIGGILPLLLGWTLAWSVVTRAWNRSLVERHLDALELRVRLVALEAETDSGRLTPQRLAGLARQGGCDLSVLDSSDRLLPPDWPSRERFLPERGEVRLVAERDLPGGRVVRASLPPDRLEAHHPVAWLLAGLALFAGTILPLYLLWRLLRGERARIRHLVEIARAAERGARPPDPPEIVTQDFAQAIDLARSLGAEIRAKRLGERVQERRTQRFAEALAEGVVLIDDQARVLLCNRAAVHILGFVERTGSPSPRNARGRSLFSLTPRLEFLEDLREALLRPRPHEFDLAGGPRTFRVRSSPAPLQTGRTGWILTLSDVTASREAERLQSRIVSDVSHEFKTPLTSIRGFAETLLDEQEDSADGFLRRSLERILAATSHLEELVRDLLDLGQMRESGRVRREPTDLSEVAREAVAALEAQAMHRLVRVVLEPPESPAVLGADKGRLLRAAMNLLSNAIKYSPLGGVVTLRVRREPEALILEVADQGPGIPAEAQPHLFERFYRVDHGRSRDMGGTGLGLAIVREVAESHGGSAGLESEPGRGSTFHLRLPTGQAEISGP